MIILNEQKPVSDHVDATSWPTAAPRLRVHSVSSWRRCPAVWLWPGVATWDMREVSQPRGPAKPPQQTGARPRAVGRAPCSWCWPFSFCKLSIDCKLLCFHGYKRIISILKYVLGFMFAKSKQHYNKNHWILPEALGCFPLWKEPLPGLGDSLQNHGYPGGNRELLSPPGAGALYSPHGSRRQCSKDHTCADSKACCTHARC